MFLWTFMILFQFGVDVLMDNIATCIVELKCVGVNESTSRISNFWNWVDHQSSEFMLSFYGHVGLAFEFMDLNQCLVIF
jgi:hypothetical protein